MKLGNLSTSVRPAVQGSVSRHCRKLARYLGKILVGTAAIGTLAAAGFPQAMADEKKMVFIQYQPHTVSLAWSKGIEQVLTNQEGVEYSLLDGQGKVDVQISLMDTVINQNVDAIFIQPVDSVAISPAIKKAKRKGIPVITLNINATAKHAAHVEMNHYFGARQIAKVMGNKMGGKGEVAILNAPPGIIIRDQRTNGFIDGMKEFHPGIQIVANQVADWSRKKAQDVFSTILVANPNVSGVYGINDSMALGAVDVAKAKGLLDNIVIFGNDGEQDALESIERGELSGTQYTDVYQQGRYAASVATVLTTGNVDADDIKSQGHLLMPYIIATKDNVAEIKADQRW